MISAEVIADSIDDQAEGWRVTTMVVTMHRFVLAEFNTHRVFSRNSASSRAIPLQRQIKRIREGVAYPVKWASEKPGMSGGDEIDHPEIAKAVWERAADDAVTFALRLRELGVHKSIINRLLEPFMYHTVIVTSTEWENFFALRCHPAAQPEIRATAELMRDAYDASEPRELAVGEWHAPFTDDLQSGIMPAGLSLDISREEFILKASAARCAWVSTLKHGQDATWADVQRIYSILTDGLQSGEPIHASPFEHQCTPAADKYWPRGTPGNLVGWRQLRHMIEQGREPWRE